MKFTKKEFAKYMDHSALKPFFGESDVIRMAGEAKEWNFAALSVNPVHIKLATSLLKGTEIHVNPCIAFPFGAISSEWKAWEAEKCITNGATEIDMVANLGAIKESKWDVVQKDIEAVIKVSQNVGVKVIIETAYLTDEMKRKAAIAVADAGAAFVKTSTGYAPAGATVHDIMLLHQTVGDRIKVKAAGGIRHFEDAVAMIKAGASRIASSSSIQIMREGGFG
ncbi:MAG: deoxyribose-phosphate aldolase [Candidatus Heimdallarchaeota archaeon]|nr:deoxyribose-phosphate aldolase [Candidatus Heimdallarchaeota archaeon]